MLFSGWEAMALFLRKEDSCKHPLTRPQGVTAENQKGTFDTTDWREENKPLLLSYRWLRFCVKKQLIIRCLIGEIVLSIADPMLQLIAAVIF